MADDNTQGGTTGSNVPITGTDPTTGITYSDGLVIVGTDGIPPVYEPDSVWKTWSYNEIYFGQSGDGKYVPKIDDYVVKPDTDEWFKIIGIDSTTLIPTLSGLTHIEHTTITSVNNKPETYRVYLDKSTMPYTLTVDARYWVAGTGTDYAMIFQGSELTDSQTVISMVFDQNDNMVSQRVPLQSIDGTGKKVVAPCYTTANLDNGEFVSVVCYNDQGGIVSISDMIIVNTGVTRQVDTSVSYITDITLESAFMSDNDPQLLSYPLNVPVNGLNLFGVVHYSDGTTKRYPVDGTKFRVLGLRDYVATVAGYTFNFTLRYTVDDDEIIVSSTSGLTNLNDSITGDKFCTKTYKAITTDPDGAYATKLYCYPEWVNEVVGYRLTFYLLNLDRSICKYVTDKVRFNENSADFNGKRYGTTQRISVSINLKDANVALKNYIHTQVIDVRLMREGGSNENTLWTIGYEIGQLPYYGEGNHAEVNVINENLARFNIALGEVNYQAWLERIWKYTKPLYDDIHESYAPEPNYFRIISANTTTEYPISQWNQMLEINDLVEDNETVYVSFIKRTNDTDLYVGISGLPVSVIEG